MDKITLCPSSTLAELARFAETHGVDLYVSAVFRDGVLKPRLTISERKPQAWVPRIIAKDQP